MPKDYSYLHEQRSEYERSRERKHAAASAKGREAAEFVEQTVIPLLRDAAAALQRIGFRASVSEGGEKVGCAMLRIQPPTSQHLSTAASSLEFRAQYGGGVAMYATARGKLRDAEPIVLSGNTAAQAERSIDTFVGIVITGEVSEEPDQDELS